MNVKAIVTDLDGTLLNSHGKVSPKNREALALAHEQGILVGICTGRELTTVLESIKKWKIDKSIDFIIASNGSQLADFIHDKNETRFPLQGETINEIIKAFDGLKVGFAFPYEGKLYTSKRTALLSLMSMLEKTPFIKEKPDKLIQRPYPKAMVMASSKLLPSVKERGQSFVISHPSLYGIQTGPVLFELGDKRTTKEAGLRWAAETLGISLTDIVAFGDADNDISVIETVGMGVAMANGSVELLKKAKATTLDNVHDGVAEYIDKHILK
jgi:Cof subfamily protein (haloacid dehalogenase superfamily)